MANIQSIRLEALKTDPQSFGTPYKSLHKKPDAYWKEAVIAMRGQSPSVVFCCFDNEAALGLISCFKDQKHDEVAHIAGLWVRPSHRGQGIATRLLQTALKWARDQRFQQAKLWNNTNNLRGQKIYEQLGFQMTSNTDKMRSDPNQIIREMRLSLSGA